MLVCSSNSLKALNGPFSDLDVSPSERKKKWNESLD